jgi:hypothetical protein
MMKGTSLPKMPRHVEHISRTAIYVLRKTHHHIVDFKFGVQTSFLKLDLTTIEQLSPPFPPKKYPHPFPSFVIRSFIKLIHVRHHRIELICPMWLSPQPHRDSVIRDIFVPHHSLPTILMEWHTCTPLGRVVRPCATIAVPCPWGIPHEKRL